MADGRLFTVRDIARELGLPESTVRYYRDAFASYLPAVGTGRRRRYPPEAIPVLRLVAEGYAQNRPRGEIEHALGELIAGAADKVAPAVIRAPLVAEPPRDNLLATILDGERERREVMWQMARELVRLGEAIERQQVLLSRLADQVAARLNALPPSPEGWDRSPEGSLPEAAAPPPPDELETLRRELAHERELVERLRRSKLDIERRVAQAEAQLGAESEPERRRGLLGRLLNSDDHPRR